MSLWMRALLEVPDHLLALYVVFVNLLSACDFFVVGTHDPGVPPFEMWGGAGFTDALATSWLF